MAVRIPAYSDGYSLTVNGAECRHILKEGYAYLPELKTGDKVILTLDGTPHFVYASSKVAANTGKAAIQRGPLIYCFEGVDNEQDVLSLRLKKEGKITLEKYQPELLGGTQRLFVEAVRLHEKPGLYFRDCPEEKECTAIAVPYYTWGNRGENQMRVWMNFS